MLRAAFIVFYIMAAAKSVKNEYFYQNRELDFNILDEMKIRERQKIQSLQTFVNSTLEPPYRNNS